MLNSSQMLDGCGVGHLVFGGHGQETSGRELDQAKIDDDDAHHQRNGLHQPSPKHKNCRQPTR